MTLWQIQNTAVFLLDIAVIYIYLRQTWLFINNELGMEHPRRCINYNQHTYMNEFIKQWLVSDPSLVLNGKQTSSKHSPDYVISWELHNNYVLPPTDPCNTKLEIISIYVNLQELYFISNIILQWIHILFLCNGNIFGTSIRGWCLAQLKSIVLSLFRFYAVDMQHIYLRISWNSY